MSQWQKKTGAALLVALLAACGGSGSTGLIVPESALLVQVREGGSCVEANGTTYCPTDATSPDGQQVDSPLPGPAEPCQPSGDCGNAVGFVFRPTGFAAGAACALATRRADASEPWSVSPPVPIDSSSDRLEFRADLPEGFAAGDVLEAALLCFDEAPSALLDALASLADAAPDVIFVAPLLPAAGGAAPS
jgi:hypothetical protein